MSDDLRVTASDERAAVQDALGAHLGQEIRVREIFATESQLYSGYLIIVGGSCYFLCARYGEWGVHSEFVTSAATGIEVKPSFSTDDLFEVRVLVLGRLYRFLGLDQRGATALARAVEAAGGEAAEIRPKRQPPPARKRLSFSDSLSARPSYEVGAATQASSFSRSLSSSPPLPPPPPSSSAGPQAPAKAFPVRTVSRSFSEVMADVHDDDDDDDDDDDVDSGGDSIFDSVEDDDDNDDSGEFEKLLAEMDQKVVASEPKTNSASAPKVRPFARGIIAAFLFPLITGLAYQSELADLTLDPELGPYVRSVIQWCTIAICGGIVSLNFGRIFAMLIAGALAGVAIVSVLSFAGPIGFVASLVGWFLLGWVYIVSRGGSWAMMKAGLLTAGMMMFSDVGPSEGAAMILVGVFWLMHAFWERADLNAAAKAKNGA